MTSPTYSMDVPATTAAGRLVSDHRAPIDRVERAVAEVRIPEGAGASVGGALAQYTLVWSDAINALGVAASRMGECIVTSASNVARGEDAASRALGGRSQRVRDAI